MKKLFLCLGLLVGFASMQAMEQRELAFRKRAISNQRGLVALCKHKILQNENVEQFILSSKDFYRIPGELQTELLAGLLYDNPKAIYAVKAELQRRKDAVNNDRGLFMLCQYAILQDETWNNKWNNFISSVNYSNFDEKVYAFEHDEDLIKLPEECKEFIYERFTFKALNYLSNWLCEDYLAYRYHWQDVKKAIEKIASKEVLVPTLLFLCSHRNSKYLSKQERIIAAVNLLSSKNYKQIPDVIKRTVWDLSGHDFLNAVQYHAKTNSMIRQHPFIADVCLGTASGFAGSLISRVLLNNFALSNDSLLARGVLGAGRVGLYYLCYKVAMKPQNDHLNTYLDSPTDYVALDQVTHGIVRFISACLGAYAGSKI